MAIITTRVANAVKTRMEQIAEKQQVRFSDISRTALYLGFNQLIKNEQLPPEITELYEQARTQQRIEMLKAQTNIIASNAHFVRRSARMLLQTHSVNAKLAKEMYAHLKQEAELRGMKEEFKQKIPPNFDEIQSQSVMLQEAKELLKYEREK